MRGSPTSTCRRPWDDLASSQPSRPRRSATSSARSRAYGRSPTTSRSRHTRAGHRRGALRRRVRRRRRGVRPVRRRGRARGDRRRLRAAPAGARHAGCDADGAELVHTDLGSNASYTWKLGGGDYEAAKAKADRVFTRHYVNQRLIPMAMEPRAVVAAPTGSDGELTLWTSTQIPHIVRVLLSLTAGIPEHKLRVVAPDVGGGFGSKLQFYREETIAAVRRAAARPAGQVGRDPVRERAGHPPRPRPAAGGRARRQERRQHPRHARRSAGQHGRRT